MEVQARRSKWQKDGLAQRMTFSAFSRSPDDLWGHAIARPFQIGLLPGYSIPAELDLMSADALWYGQNTVTKPVIVWDGFSPTALFEVIYECFDNSMTNPYIVVRNAVTGEILRDPRDPEILAVRPRRTRGMGARARRNHLVELMYWSKLLPVEDDTNNIYAEILFDDTDGSCFIDSRRRFKEIISAGLTYDTIWTEFERIYTAFRKKELSLPGGIKRGPFLDEESRVEKLDLDVPLLETFTGATMYHADIDMDDVRSWKEAGKDMSFYRMSAEKGREKRAKIHADVEAAKRRREGA